MKNINYGRIILFTGAIAAAIVSFSLTKSESTYSTLVSSPQTHASYETVAYSGIHNSSLGFSLLSGFCMLGFAITYLKRD